MLELNTTIMIPLSVFETSGHKICGLESLDGKSYKNWRCLASRSHLLKRAGGLFAGDKEACRFAAVPSTDDKKRKSSSR